MRVKPSRLALAVVSLLCIVSLAACGSSAPRLRGITVAPTTASIDNTTTQQFTATAYYSDGTTQDATGVAGWTSSSPLVATVSSAGVATALSNGTTTITASVGSFTATAVLTVARTLTSLTISPLSKTVGLGQTQQFVAMGTYLNADGTTSGPTDISTLVTWNSSDATIATVDNTGLATTLKQGPTNISASLDSLTTPNAVLTVGAPVVVGLQVTPAAPNLAIGNTSALVALELLSDTTTQPLTGPVTWSEDTCGGTAGAVVLTPTSTNGTEIASAALVAACTVTATENTLTGTSTVTVVTGITHFAYVGNPGNSTAGSSTIGGYAVDATSTTAPLTPTAQGTVAASQPQQSIVHPSGLFVYSVDGVSNVTVYTVDTTGTGALTLSTAPAVLAGFGGSNVMVIDPTGRFLYVSDDGGNGSGNSIYGFTIDQTAGTLTPIAAVTNYTTNLTAPEDLIIDQTGKYLYAINNGTNGTTPVAGWVSAYSISATGALTPLATPTYATGVAPYFAAISPNNANLYVPTSGDKSVTTFTVGANGALGGGTATVVTGSTFPHNAVVDPTSKFLYVLDFTDGTLPGALYTYNLGTAGAIGAQVGTSVATGVSPFGLALDPTGTLLLVVNNNDNTITPYSVNTTTGAPTAEATVATGIGPLFISLLNAP